MGSLSQIVIERAHPWMSSHSTTRRLSAPRELQHESPCIISFSSSPCTQAEKAEMERKVAEAEMERAQRYAEVCVPHKARMVNVL